MAEKTRSISSRLLAGTGWNLAWRVVTRSLGFISLLIMAQLLKPADIGIVALATSVSATIDALSQLGVKEALVRLHDHDLDLYDTAFSVQVGRAILTTILLLILSMYALPLLGDPRMKAVLLVYSGVSFLGAFENIGLILITRELDFKSLFFLQVVPRISGFIVTIVLAFALRNYWAIVVGSVIARIAWIVMSYVISPHRPRLGVKGWRYLLHFSFWAWLNSLVVNVWNRCDPFILGPVIGIGPLGLFMLAFEIALLPVSELLDPICASLFPGFAMAQREGSSPISMGLTVSAVLMLGTLPFAIALSATSGYLVTGLLGSAKWDHAQPLIAIMTWGCVFSPFSYVSGTALSVQGAVKRAATASGLAAMAKVLVLFLVRHQSLPIIASSVVLIFTVESIAYITQLRAAGNHELRKLGMVMARGLSAGALCCAALYFVPGTWRIVQMGRIEALIVGGGIGLAVFGVFGIMLFTIWKVFGSPDGAEKQIYRIFQERFGGERGFAV